MATSGTSHEGVDNILISAYTGLDLRLYTHTLTVDDEIIVPSLDRDSVFADLTEPSNLDDFGFNNGYAAISLTGTWSSSESVITYDHPGDPTFTNSGEQGNWVVYGSAITDGAFILAFKDFSEPIAVLLGASLVLDVSSVVS